MKGVATRVMVIVVLTQRNHFPTGGHAMRSFIQCFGSKIKGVLSGLDRIRFRGTLRWLSNLRGMTTFLSHQGILLKDFRASMQSRTEQIRQAGKQLAEQAGRPHLYLTSSAVSKEQLACDIAKCDGVTEGLVCVLTCVEPCMSFQVGPNRERKLLELRYVPGKCLHQYHYWLDPQLGPLHVRLQTWVPYTVHICLNGRDWLARQLQTRGIDFTQRDNCFVDVSDVHCAQQLLAAQVKTNGSRQLNRLLRRVHPTQHELYAAGRLEYYWSAEETEWATDVLFASAADLAALYPRWVRHAMTAYGAGDVLRFLGQRGTERHCRAAEITTSLATRSEGTRVKHARNRNSIKMYDKQQSVLRVETTINDPRDLKALRTKDGEPGAKPTWQRMRKGVADLPRRCAVSQAANERYLEGLSTVETTATVGETLAPLSQRRRFKRRSARALNVLAEEDARLLAAVGRPEFLLAGFRNKDLRAALFGEEADSPAEGKRRANKVTRLIRLLRAHQLIRKVPKTNSYQITPKGQQVVTILKAAQHADVKALTQLAA